MYSLSKSTEYKPINLVKDVFSLEEVSTIVEQLKDVNTIVGVVGNGTQSLNIRKSAVFFLKPSEPKYSWIYDRISYHVNELNNRVYRKMLYGIEPIQYSEYDSPYGGFYAAHVDAYLPENNLDTRRALSFSINLTEDYTGGELMIYDKNEPTIASKQIGSGTFFEPVISHEVKPVKSGFRKTLVGWVRGPRV
jgi:PKHD-type hydroxylase